MEKLGDILRYTRPQRVLTAAMVCHQAQQVVGAGAVVVSFNQGALKLKVADNYQAAQLAQDNLGLIERVNQRLGQPLVKKLKFEVAAS